MKRLSSFSPPGHVKQQPVAANNNLYRSFLAVCAFAAAISLLGITYHAGRSSAMDHDDARRMLQQSSVTRGSARKSTAGSSTSKADSEEDRIALELFTMTYEYLIQFGFAYKQQYRDATPFPHVAIDDLFPKKFLDKVVEELPEGMIMDDGCLDKNRCRVNEEENKKSFIREEDMMGPYTKMLLSFMSSATFIEFLELMTGIPDLMTDPKRAGSGVHFVGPGGFLDIHADFNEQADLHLWRRVNTFIFLNPDWKPEYGGDLELWSRDMKSCHASIPPIKGRFVIFTSTDFSYHGHPQPLKCPPGRARRSIAMYYYTRTRPKEACSNPDDCSDHGTMWQKPQGCNKCMDDACMRIDPDEPQVMNALSHTEFHPPMRLNPSGKNPREFLSPALFGKGK